MPAGDPVEPALAFAGERKIVGINREVAAFPRAGAGRGHRRGAVDGLQKVVRLEIELAQDVVHPTVLHVTGLERFTIPVRSRPSSRLLQHQDFAGKNRDSMQ